MRNFFIIFAAAMMTAACLMQACRGDVATQSPLEQAEQAFENGRYSTAQIICDSLAPKDGHSNASVSELCRLSLLFMKLGDYSGDIDTNTAQAARTLMMAIERNADSTLVFLNTVPVEDQARVAILTAINEARNAPAITDTITYDY
ncbi:MAG: hypothetical protein K2K22_04775 [Muribaculaceae bacterium]|nr:hypothetical protein [Muribaculaceae bacterium]MDE6611858.1 hypothetical protein [Muribaculaceae bacterium]